MTRREGLPTTLHWRYVGGQINKHQLLSRPEIG